MSRGSITLFNISGYEFQMPIVDPVQWIGGDGPGRVSKSKRLKAKRAKQMRKLRRKQGRL